MSLQTKNRIAVWSKRASIALFAVLFLFNIKFTFTDDAEKGDISLLGVKLTLSNATAAESEPDKYHKGPLGLNGEDYCCKDTDGSICASYPKCP